MEHAWSWGVYSIHWGLNKMVAIFSETFPYGLGHETAAVLLPGFAINW